MVSSWICFLSDDSRQESMLSSNAYFLPKIPYCPWLLDACLQSLIHLPCPSYYLLCVPVLTLFSKEDLSYMVSGPSYLNMILNTLQ